MMIKSVVTDVDLLCSEAKEAMVSTSAGSSTPTTMDDGREGEQPVVSALVHVISHGVLNGVNLLSSDSDHSPV